MESIDHTISWCKGEILEGRIILVFAAIIFIIDHFSEEQPLKYQQEILEYNPH